MRQFFCQRVAADQNVINLAYIAKVTPTDEVYIRGIHQHDHVTEVSLVMAGSGNYFIKDGHFPVQQNDAVVINAGTLHSEGAILPSLCIGIRTPTLINATQAPVFHLTQDQFDLLAQIGNLGFDLLKRPDRAAHELANNLIISSLLPFLRTSLTAPQPLTRTTPVIVSRAKGYIDDHFHDFINISDVCARLALSHTYLDRKFQDNLAMTPIRYLTSRRVGEAQRLLIEAPKLTLTQVSLQIGINNVNYFQRCFKNYAGVSPKRFRTVLVIA